MADGGRRLTALSLGGLLLHLQKFSIVLQTGRADCPLIVRTTLIFTWFITEVCSYCSTLGTASPESMLVKI